MAEVELRRLIERVGKQQRSQPQEDAAARRAAARQVLAGAEARAAGTEGFTQAHLQDFMARQSQVREVQQEQQATATATNERFQSILRDLGQDTELEVDKWRDLAEYVIRMKSVPTQQEGYADIHKTADSFLAQYGDQLKPHIDARAGEEWWDENVTEAGEPGVLGKAGRALAGSAMNLLESLDAPRKGAFSLIGNIAKGDPVAGVGGFAQGLASFGQDFSNLIAPGVGLASQELYEIKAPDLSAFDVDESGYADIFEVFSGGTKARPEWANGWQSYLIDLGAEILFDPLTWTTAGAGGASRKVLSALKVAGAGTGSDAAAAKYAYRVLRRHGAKAIRESEPAQEAVERVIRQLADRDIIRKAGKAADGKGQEALAKSMWENRRALAKLHERRISRYTKALKSTGRGVKVGGKNVVPFSPLLRLYEDVGLLGTMRLTGPPAVRAAQIADSVQFMPAVIDDVAVAFAKGDLNDVDGLDALRDLVARRAGGESIDQDVMEMTIDAITNDANMRAVVGWDDEVEARVYELISGNNLDWFSRELDADELALVQSRVAPHIGRTPSADELDNVIRKLYDATTGGGRGLELSPSVERRSLSEVMPAVKRETIDTVDELMDNVVLELRITRPRLAKTILDHRWMDKLRKAFVPRGRLARSQGREAAEKLDTVVAAQKATADAQSQRVAVQALKPRWRDSLIRRAEGELGGESPLNAVVNDALANPDEWAATLRTHENLGNTNVVGTLKMAQRIRDETYNAAIAAGADPSILGPKDAYIPRILSKAGQLELHQATLRNPEIRGKVGNVMFQGLRDQSERKVRDLAEEAALREDSFLRPRGFVPEMQDLLEVNEAFRGYMRELGIDFQADVFESNALTAMAVRHRSAMESLAVWNTYQAMEDVGTVAGKKMGYFGSSTEEIIRKLEADGFDLPKKRIMGDEGPEWVIDEKKLQERVGDYVKVKTPGGGMAGLVHVDISDELANTHRLIYDSTRMSDARKFMNNATSLWAGLATVPLVGTGFHARNFLGNLFNMALAGAKDPTVLRDAQRLQSQGARIRRAMRETGQSWDKAAESLGIDDEVLDAAIKHGVYGGQFADIFDEERGGSWLQKKIIKPVVYPGRHMGQTIENNARLGLFIDQVKKGYSYDEAAATVRKYLFDYADLTRFESDALRMVSRFYTFMRKNMALQYWTLLNYPGRTVNAQRVVETGVESLFGGSEEYPGIAPDWVKVAGMDYFSGQNAFATAETPLFAAGEAFDNLAALVSTIPGLDTKLPPHLMWGTAEERFNRALANFAGPASSLTDYLYGGRFSRDPFTGAPLEGSRWEEFASILLPIVPKAMNYKRRFVDGDDFPEGQLWNALAGLMYYEMTPNRQAGPLYAIEDQMEQALDAIRDEYGRDVIPTFAQLEESGRIAQVNRIMYAAMYGELDEQLVREVLPADVERIMGLVRETDLRADDTDIVARTQEVRSAIELMYGRELTKDEWLQFAVALPWAPSNSILEDLGIEPQRFGNRFIPKEEQQLNLLAEAGKLSQIGSALGLTNEDFTRMRPLLTDIERALREGALVGMGPDQVAEWWIENELNRTERGILLGTDSLERFYDGSNTQADIDAARRRARERAAEIRTIVYTITGQFPSDEMVTYYVYANELSKTDQRSLGLPVGPRIPSRKNIQTPQEQAQDAATEYTEGILPGIDEAPQERLLSYIGQ